jgi:hypothetical protein
MWLPSIIKYTLYLYISFIGKLADSSFDSGHPEVALTLYKHIDSVEKLISTDEKHKEVISTLEEGLIEPLFVPDEIEKHEPPKVVSAILCYSLKAKDRDAVLGDLAEQYDLRVERLGKKNADTWYYAEVARSLWPLAKRSVAKVIRVATASSFFWRRP